MQDLQQQKAKRKHRRGKPKPKNSNKPYKNTNWKFQIPRLNYNFKGGSGVGIGGGGGGCGIGSGGGGGSSGSMTKGARAKLVRSRSLVPYNTNKFLMEEHLAEVPSSLLTPSGRTRDSSFSVDSDDNYFYSLPEDEEEFLTKEFDNIYEKTRVERLENFTKQQLIEECLQIEDRYSSDQGIQRQHQLAIQRISAEFISKIRALEDKVRELTRENFDLRSQLMRSAALAAAAAASPPSASAPTDSACQPTPMDSSSEDTESDSSTSSSSSAASISFNDDNGVEDDADYAEADDDSDDAGKRYHIALDCDLQKINEDRNHSSRSSTRSSLSEYDMAAVDREDQLQVERHQILETHMEEEEGLITYNDRQQNSSSPIKDFSGLNKTA